MSKLNIGVIGGGPAGSFFSILALRLAKELNKDISITIFDRKDFCDPGPKGCNMCAGILQSSMVERLEKLNIPLAPEIITGTIAGYAFHLKGLSAYIKRDSQFPIYTITRGGGPLGVNDLDPPESFDQFMLNQAIKEGTNFIHERVNKIELQTNGDVKIFFGEEKKESSTVNFLVGAFGVNTALLREIPFKYRPPPTWYACQAEIPLGRDYIAQRFGDLTHVFFTKRYGLKFVAITPKKNYITLTAMGQNVKINDLYQEIAVSEIKDFLPPNWHISCYCYPQMPVGPAYHPYTHNCLIIGDASYSRYLKNGIESAFLTAQFAAETIIRHGTSQKDLAEHYDRQCKNNFYWDNLAGKLLFLFHDLISTNRLQSETYLNLVRKEQKDLIQRRRLSKILWHLYTGDVSYSHVLLQALDPALQIRLTYETMKGIGKHLLGGKLND